MDGAIRFFLFFFASLLKKDPTLEVQLQEKNSGLDDIKLIRQNGPSVIVCMYL